MRDDDVGREAADAAEAGAPRSRRSSTHRGIGSFAPPSACARIVRPGSCCAPRSSITRRSFTTSVTAARGCRCRGARRRWPPISRCRMPNAKPRCSVPASSGSPPRASCSVTASTSRSMRLPFRPTRRRTCRWPAGRRRRDSSTTDKRTAAWDAQVPAGRRDCVSTPAAAGGSEVRRLVDHALLADGQRAVAAEGGGNRESAVSARSCRCRDDAVLGLVPGEHPFPTKYAIERERDAHRAVDLSRRADERLPAVGRQGRDPKVRDAARRRRAAARTSIVNCTGLGSKALFNDPELMPLKGQLVVLIPQSEITYATSGAARQLPPESGFMHMMPRSDGIVLGGTSIRDDWSTRRRRRTNASASSTCTSSCSTRCGQRAAAHLTLRLGMAPSRRASRVAIQPCCRRGEGVAMDEIAPPGKVAETRQDSIGLDLVCRPNCRATHWCHCHCDAWRRRPRQASRRRRRRPRPTRRLSSLRRRFALTRRQ